MKQYITVLFFISSMTLISSNSDTDENIREETINIPVERFTQVADASSESSDEEETTAREELLIQMLRQQATVLEQTKRDLRKTKRTIEKQALEITRLEEMLGQCKKNLEELLTEKHPQKH